MNKRVKLWEGDMTGEEYPHTERSPSSHSLAPSLPQSVLLRNCVEGLRPFLLNESSEIQSPAPPRCVAVFTQGERDRQREMKKTVYLLTDTPPPGVAPGPRHLRLSPCFPEHITLAL